MSMLPSSLILNLILVIATMAQPAKQVTIKFHPALLPKQLQLLKAVEESKATNIGFGGSRGGSKSAGGRAVMLFRRLTYKNTGGLILRKTVDDLYDNHIRPMFREYPWTKQYWRDQKKVLDIPNGSFLRFISADKYDDIFDLLGKEFADIMVDQAEQFFQEQLEFIQTLNRCTTNDEITPKMMWMFNPGDVGHQFLKRVFVLQQYEGNEQATDYQFIRAYGWDNGMWCRKELKKDGKTVGEFGEWSDKERFEYFVSRSDYGRKLNRLPDSQRKAQLFGDFDVFEGQFFEVWRDRYHVLNERFDPPRDEYGNIVGKVQAAIDYGDRTVLEVQYRDFEGTITQFAESYTEAKVPEERFNAMADLLLERKLYRLPIECDTNMDISLKNYTGYDKKIIKIAQEVFQDRMGENKPILSVVNKQSSNDKGYRIACNEAFMQYLSWKVDPATGELTRKPLFRSTVDCRHFNETLPGLMRDKNSRDGLDFRDDVGIDDAYDSAKYAFMKLRTPIAVVTEKIKTEDDYMEKFVFSKIRQKALQPVPQGGLI